ncbi:MAG: DUF4276 family protein [Gemmataceae bacterium]
MTLYVAPIVEGHTEVHCVERLLQRLWHEVLSAPDRLQVLDVTRGDRSSLVHDSHQALAEKIEEAHSKLRRLLRRDPSGRGLLLLLLDADQDCPKALALKLLSRAAAARGDAQVACVLANRELENWFKAAAASLAGQCGLPADLTTPPDPEAGKGSTWLTEQMRRVDRNRPYKKPADSLDLARHMDLADALARSRSFRKLCDELRKRLPPAPETPCTPSA